jgi:hypothetical protein
MTSTIQLQKKFSKILNKPLQKLGPDFGKLQSKVDAVFEQGRKEGFSDMEIGEFVRYKMKEHHTDRTIRAVLPNTAKHQEKAREQKDFVEKTSTNEHEKEPLELPSDKVIVTKRLADVEAKTVEGIDNNSYLTDAETTPQPLESADQKHGAAPEAPLQPELAHQKQELLLAQKFGVDNFEIEKLNTYSLRYCRKVIRYLDECQRQFISCVAKWDKCIHERAISFYLYLHVPLLVRHAVGNGKG